MGSLNRKDICKMDSALYFPNVHIARTEAGVNATLGIVIKSILKSNLIRIQEDYQSEKGEADQGTNPQYFQACREAFLRALSGWPDHLTMEIKITTAPDLICRPQGKIHIAILLHAHAETEGAAKEEILSRFLAMMPLLNSHFPEIEFLPITDIGKLRSAMFFPQATHAFTIHRRVHQINLSEPFRKRVAGLQAAPHSGDDGRFMIKHRYPWIPSLDDWSHLMDTMINQLDPIQLIVRLKTANINSIQLNELENNLRHCELFLSGGEPYQIAMKKQVEMIRDVTLGHLSDLTSSCFQAGVCLLAMHPLDISMGHVTGHAITGHTLLKDHRLFSGDFRVSAVDVQDALDSGCFYEKECFSVTEAASVFRFPSPPTEDLTGLPVRRCRTGLAVAAQYHSSGEHEITLFVNEHKHIVQPISIKAEDRMRHTFIIGQTGTGKSTLMESMILQDIKGGQGLAVIDPHGDLIDDILGKIPPERMEDVILFDVLDREHPVGFNILQWYTVDERDLIIDELYTVLDHIYDMKQTGGPIFESNFRGMLKLLMGEKRQDDFTPTILNFMMCYLNEEFLDWLGSRTEDPANRDFIRELKRTGGEVSLRNIAPYITSKFSRYINDTTLMRIIGQEQTSFDFDDIMNNGRIFLVKLGKGRFGSQVSSLLANMLVSRFKYAAMKRGDLPKNKRRDFYLYVDEFHNLPSENFTELLSEARKFRMSLTMATQYTAQISSRDTRDNLLSAVIGNVGTFVCFRIGQEDAKIISSVFHPYFSPLDIIGLPNWQGYARLQQGVDVVPPFSFRSYRDQTVFSEKQAKRTRAFSRFMYGMDSETVDMNIRKQRGAWRKPVPRNYEEKISGEEISEEEINELAQCVLQLARQGVDNHEG